MLRKQTVNIIVLLSAVFCLLTPAAHAEPLKYIYINASEGNASGGHTALRFGAETFHFQHYDGGIIRLVKHSSTDFDYQYRYLENRTFHQATIELNDIHYQQLKQHFNSLLLLQKRQNTLLRELDLNIALFHKQYQDSILSIRGAGLFDNNTAPSAAEALSILSLQRRIDQKYGATFLDKKIQQLKAQISTLEIQPWPQSSLQFTTNSFLTVPYSFASHHIDSVSQILLLEMIKNGRPLNKQSYFSPEHAHFRLSVREIKQLRVLQNSLLTNLVNLLSSQRPDWGGSGFVLYARILSLAHSIQLRKFVFLDSFSTNSPKIPPSEVELYKDSFIAQKELALSKVYLEKKHLFTAQQEITEKQYSRFEMLSNYYYERERGLETQHEIRVSGERLLPTKAVPFPQQLLPELDNQQAKNEIHKLKEYKQKLTQQIQSLYHYDLFTRNCVTEIFSNITNAQLDNPQMADIQQIISDSLTAFIPYGSFDRIAEQYPTVTLPSFRRQQLQKMYRRENVFRVYLREFNTLSAQDYKYNDQDAPFLFFTDDKLWLRPLFGSANILTATSVSLYGGFTFPFDSGKTLRSGMMGILMSLPELAFFNIRKGSYKYLIPPMQTE